MRYNFPKVPLHEVLTPVSRPETVNPQSNYSLLGAHWYADGLYVKEIKSGSQIQANKLYRIEEGDFVYNRLFAWKGSFALASKENHDCYVSNEFPCFIVNHDLADGRYLWRYFSRAAAWDEALGLSKGSTPTSRNRLKEENLLGMKIFLPPLSEQRRLVARIDDFSAKIEEARGLKKEAMQDTDRLLSSMAHRKDLSHEEKIRQGWTEVSLHEILEEAENAYIVKTDESYPNLGIYSFGRGLFKKPPIQGFSTSAPKLYRVQKGQFIYSRLFAFEGAYGWVSDEFDGFFVSGEYPTFDCDLTRVRAEFLYAYFKSPAIWEVVAIGSKGLGHRRQRVKSEQFLSHRLLLPPLELQARIAEMMNNTSALNKTQSDTVTALDALLPSILDKAFKGEL